MKVLFIIYISFFGACFCASIRSAKEIENYRQFLINSVNGKPDEPINEKLKNLQPEWERSGKFEGDIILTDEQIDFLVAKYAGDYNERNANLDPFTLWPNGTMFYDYTPGAFTLDQIGAIESVMANISRLSCVKFAKANPTTKAYVLFKGESGGCSATVGYTGKVQNLNLAPSPVGQSCMRLGTITHEILHSLGFHHMQTTHNRDEYVEIVWEKIKPGKEHNFVMYDNKTVTNLGVEYDYGSILHYSEYGFSIDGSKTIIPLKETNKTLGQRDGMDKEDILKLNRLYNCEARS